LVESPKGNVSLNASKLVLGGAGVSLEAKAEARDAMMEGLNIIIIEKNDNSIPEVDLELDADHGD
jgi:hypothetical protein